jgi:glutathione S-transferase
MKIAGSLTSPFVRLVRVVCEELRVPYELEATPPFSKLDEKQEKFINTHNPLMKVPFLIDGDNVMLDSRIIVGYLLSRNAGNGDFRSDFPASPQEDNVLTVIMGIIDAGILRFVMKAAHPEIKADSGYMARSIARMEHGFSWLDRQMVPGHGFGVPEAALICGMDWLRKRKIYEWQAFSNIVKIRETYCGRQSLAKTGIPEAA